MKDRRLDTLQQIAIDENFDPAHIERIMKDCWSRPNDDPKTEVLRLILHQMFSVEQLVEVARIEADNESQVDAILAHDSVNDRKKAAIDLIVRDEFNEARESRDADYYFAFFLSCEQLT